MDIFVEKCLDLINSNPYSKNGSLLYVCKHGSTLYGTNTENSDIDIKGIYLPPIQSVILGKYPKTLSITPKKGKDEKNKAGDLEITLYSLQEFLKMCIDGETISIDMLNSHSTHAALFINSRAFDLFDNHELFYTKNMKAFLGYAKRQVNKYGMKGTRLAALKDVYDFIKEEPEWDYEVYPDDTFKIDRRLKELYNSLPINEFCFFVEKPEMKYYSILDALYQPNITVKEFKELVQKKWESYGERSRKAMENEGIDWKACSHALRAAYQLIEIYTRGSVRYPLKHREQLLQVKQGKMDFNTFGELLDFKIKQVEKLAQTTHYPKEVDIQFWDNYLLKCYGL